MASFSIEDFVGNGSLKELLPRLLDEGWDDVPTLKVMNSDDMDDIGLTRQQKVGFPIKIFLHITPWLLSSSEPIFLSVIYIIKKGYYYKNCSLSI